MKIYHNGFDWYVAHDFSHLGELVREQTGFSYQDEENLGVGWDEWPSHCPIVIGKETLLPYEWALRNGPGILFSAEY